jgi:hypothetical protein
MWGTVAPPSRDHNDERRAFERAHDHEVGVTSDAPDVVGDRCAPLPGSRP